MKTRFKASLEKTMDEWIHANCEEEDWFNDVVRQQLITEHLHRRMADAAEVVFDTAIESAEFTEMEHLAE